MRLLRRFEAGADHNGTWPWHYGPSLRTAGRGPTSDSALELSPLALEEGCEVCNTEHRRERAGSRVRT
jgi:hypothetical protein